MTASSGMDRRALLQRALILAGAAALPGGSQALAAAVQAGKRQLDRARFALLAAVADTIVPKTDTPGAVDAGVPEKFDALLHTWASPTRRAELIAALDAIDTLSRQKLQKRFAVLSPNVRHELLAAHDLASLQSIPRSNSVADESDLFMAGPPVANPAYAKLKELIVVLFYLSETALTHDLVYEHTPGEWRPSIPLTPETRANGGADLI